MVHGGFRSRLTYSDYSRASRRRAKRMSPLCVRRTYALRVISGCFGSSRAILVANESAIRLSSISGGRKRTSLYRAVAYVVL
jgi:hypothetical protein